MVIAAGGSLFIIEGCNAASVFASIQVWIPVGEKAFAGIVTLVGPFLPPGTAAIVTLVNASLTALGDVIAEYMAASAAAKSTLLGKIQTALTAVSDNISNFLAALNLSGNPLIAVISGLAQIILSTIAAFMAALPAPVAGAMTIKKSFVLSGVTFPIVPKMRTVAQFKASYNAIADANNHPEVDLQ
jgi:hypothetical protein